VLPVPPPLKNEVSVILKPRLLVYENVVTMGKGLRSIGSLLVRGCITSGAQRHRVLDGAGSLQVPGIGPWRCGGTGGEMLELRGGVQSCPPPRGAETRPDLRNPATE